jgi:glycosyltransferase involved in cell wall biosynthesis
MKRTEASISVIIPCYRCDATIERAISSVFFQTMIPREVILVEDCSDDGERTINALNRLRKKYWGDVESIQVLVLERNQGPAVARNTGWDAAQQPYIAFLDADDSWHPRKLEIQHGWMEQHPEIALTCHRSLCLRSGRSVPGLPDTMHYRPVSRTGLLLSNQIATRSVMVRRDIPYRFETEMKYSEDYYLWLEIVFNGYSATYLDSPLCYSYESGFLGSGLSADLWQMEKGELDTYKRLFREKLISLLTLFLLVVVSFVKYTRRLIIKFLSFS